jgi:hypothetical protein
MFRIVFAGTILFFFLLGTASADNDLQRLYQRSVLLYQAGDCRQTLTQIEPVYRQAAEKNATFSGHIATMIANCLEQIGEDAQAAIYFEKAFYHAGEQNDYEARIESFQRAYRYFSRQDSEHAIKLAATMLDAASARSDLAMVSYLRGQLTILQNSDKMIFLKAQKADSPIGGEQLLKGVMVPQLAQSFIATYEQKKNQAAAQKSLSEREQNKLDFFAALASIAHDHDCIASYLLLDRGAMRGKQEWASQGLFLLEQCFVDNRPGFDAILSTIAENAALFSAISGLKMGLATTYNQSCIASDLFEHSKEKKLISVAARFDLARQLDSFNELYRAERQYLDILAICRQHTGPQADFFQAFALQQLGLLYVKTGRASKAEQSLRQAVAKLPWKTMQVPDILSAPVAEHFFLSVPTTFEALAGIAIEQGNIARAIYLYEQAIDTINANQSKFSDRPRLTAHFSLLLAKAYLEHNDRSKAIAQAQKTIDNCNNNLEFWSAPLAAGAYLVLAKAFFAGDEITLAERNMDLALKHFDSDDPRLFWQTIDALFIAALYKARQNQHPLASQGFLQIVQSIDAFRKETIFLFNQHEQAELTRRYKFYLDALITHFIQTGKGNADDVLNAYLNWQGFLGYSRNQLMAQVRLLGAQGGSNRRFIEQLFEVHQNIASQMAHPSIDQKSMRVLMDRKNSLQYSLAQELFPTQAPLTTDRWKQHSIFVEGKTGLVALIKYIDFDFATGRILPERYAAFLTDGKTNTQAICVGRADAIDKTILGYQRAIEQAIAAARLPDFADLDRSASALAASMTAQFFGATAKFSQLFVICDGLFSLFPISVLPYASGKLIADRQLVFYIDNIRDLLTVPLPDTQSMHRVAIFADPDYDNEPLIVAQTNYVGVQTRGIAGIVPFKILPQDQSRFTRLMDTRTEALKIDQILSRHAQFSVEQFVAAAAAEQNLLNLPSPWILHLATHGKHMIIEEAHAPHTRKIDSAYLFDPAFWRYAPPAQSQTVLALAGANTTEARQTGDGYLTAGKIEQLDLTNTQLVVLSACSTNLGTIEATEGIYGLQRAFLTSGARQVLATLWPVASKQTQQLMSHFYQYYSQDRNSRKALVSAQQAIRSEYNHPYYWAAFKVVGFID